jgi:hypothetical protein
MASIELTCSVYAPWLAFAMIAVSSGETGNTLNGPPVLPEEMSPIAVFVVAPAIRNT